MRASTRSEITEAAAGGCTAAGLFACSRRRSRWAYPLSLLLVLSVPAWTGPPEWEAALDELESSVARARSLSLGILVEIREIRGDFPTTQVGENSRLDARRRLSHLSAAVDLFDEVVAEAEKAAERCRVALEKGSAQGEALSGPEGRAREAASQLRKQSGHVRKFYANAVRAYAPPLPQDVAPPSPTPSARQGPTGIHLSGELRTALGSSNYKQPNVRPNPVDQSSSLFEGRVEASTRLATGSLLSARISRESRVERRDITLSDVGLSIQHSFPMGWSADAEVSRQGYGEEESETAGFGETQWAAGVKYRAKRARFSAGAQRRSRSFEEDDPLGQNYSVTTLRAGGELPLGRGKLLGQLSRVARDAETPGGDFHIVNPSITWRSGRPGTEAHFSLESFSNPDNDLADNDRIKAHILLGSEGEGRRRVWGPEIQLYRFPHVQEAGFADWGVAGSQTALSPRVGGEGGRRETKRYRAYFRRFEDDSLFNFAGFSWRSRSRPRTSGLAHDWGLTGKLYVESADYDPISDVGPSPSTAEIFEAIGQIVQEFQSTRAPHLLDAHYRLGWLWHVGTVVRSIEIAPAVGHRMYIDNERNELQGLAEDLAAQLPDSLTDGKPLGNQNFLLQNTINRARWGGLITVEMEPSPGAAVRTSVQYDEDILYNADPSEKMRSFDLRLGGDYRIRPPIVLEGWLNYHKSTIGDNDSANDFNRTEIVVRLLYLFDAHLGR